MTESLLAARGIAKRYGPVVALRAVDLTVEPGEVHALLGANGAGKSTLVKILSGVIPPDTGSIEVRGAPVTIRRPRDAQRYGLATVFQDPALIGDLTVTDNLRLSGTPQEAVVEWLGRMGLGGSIEFAETVRDLPLPMQRMLDLARALAGDPLLLLLDEITATLPADLADRVFEVMGEWKSRGRSVLFISHRLAEVLAHCDHATVLRDGRDVAAFVPGEGGERRMVQAMLGEAAEAPAAAAGHARDRSYGEVALEARDLRAAGHLDGVSLRVRKGEILGVASLEGQGQEALFEVLAGDRRLDGGELLVGGRPLVARSPFDAIRRGVVLVPSDRLSALLPKRSVAENLALALHNRPAEWGLIDAAGEGGKVRRAIERLSIDTRAQSQVRRLSGGNQQKVTIGRWLAAGFATLLCFDPTRGIDVGTKRQIYDLLRELAGEGAAVILYTSELREIPLVCDRVVVMYGGRLVHEQDAATADEATLLEAAHGLEREGAA
jgi:ribose transport system ATP-binding protein